MSILSDYESSEDFEEIGFRNYFMDLLNFLYYREYDILIFTIISSICFSDYFSFYAFLTIFVALIYGFFKPYNGNEKTEKILGLIFVYVLSTSLFLSIFFGFASLKKEESIEISKIIMKTSDNHIVVQKNNDESVVFVDEGGCSVNNTLKIIKTRKFNRYFDSTNIRIECGE